MGHGVMDSWVVRIETETETYYRLLPTVGLGPSEISSAQQPTPGTALIAVAHQEKTFNHGQRACMVEWKCCDSVNRPPTCGCNHESQNRHRHSEFSDCHVTWWSLCQQASSSSYSHNVSKIKDQQRMPCHLPPTNIQKLHIAIARQGWLGRWGSCNYSAAVAVAGIPVTVPIPLCHELRRAARSSTAQAPYSLPELFVSPLSEEGTRNFSNHKHKNVQCRKIATCMTTCSVNKTAPTQVRMHGTAERSGPPSFSWSGAIATSRDHTRTLGESNPAGGISPSRAYGSPL